MVLPLVRQADRVAPDRRSRGDKLQPEDHRPASPHLGASRIQRHLVPPVGGAHTGAPDGDAPFQPTKEVVTCLTRQHAASPSASTAERRSVASPVSGFTTTTATRTARTRRREKSGTRRHHRETRSGDGRAARRPRLPDRILVPSSRLAARRPLDRCLGRTRSGPVTTWQHGDQATCCGCREIITYKTDRATDYWEHPNRYPYCRHPTCRHERTADRLGPGRPLRGTKL